MSWDLFVDDIPEDVHSVEDLEKKYGRLPPNIIGTRDEVIAKIKEVVPNADFSDPGWGQIEGPDYSIEVDISDVDECGGFVLHVRGGDAAAFVIADILEHLGLRAFDPASDTGLFELGPDGAEGLKRWRAYRDYVIGDGSD